MSVRNEPKIRSEMFREKGWKGSRESMTPLTFPAGFECWKIQSGSVVLRRLLPRASPFRPSSIARARHGCEVQAGYQSRLQVVGIIYGWVLSRLV
jgi:hypothetical protein